MEEESNRSFGADGDTKNQLSKRVEEGGEENFDEKMDENNDRRLVSSDSKSDCAVGNSSRGESKASESKTLTSVQLSESDFSVDFDESSLLLSEVPVEYALALQPLKSTDELKCQGKAVHDESLKGITGIPAEIQIHVPDGPSKLEVLPMSVTQSLSSPYKLKQKLCPVKNVNGINPTELNKQNSSDSKPLSIKPILKTPDGYNWRKYGQKQVKSPEGSRSYYRCTFSDCYAKKIECSDRSNCLIETVYRSPHTHDPPQKVNCTKESIPVLPVTPVSGINDTNQVSGINDTNQSTASSNDPVQANIPKQLLLGYDEVPETKKQESSDSDETTEINMKEYVDGAEFKKRQKRNSTGELESPSNPGKKPKYVVHAAGDVGISGDGYRWRKYGQKMVKGNPHPRICSMLESLSLPELALYDIELNYYRCTSAGCPVRKHIERAVDNTNAVVITYKGVHDHDTPVPRKRSGPKSAVSVANSLVTMDDLQNNTKQSNKSQTQWSVDKEGELTGEPLNVVGEVTPESAKTLVSIGFEIKP
ncbi:WRKY transcription factor [Castilleja foliolosa]|uniref:WRKY transcription factor n=1 Tax=Castilleja foliolosa TaxID=1961234 RepID=A0ABD3CI64_9LAMI